MAKIKEFPHALVYRVGSVFIFCLFMSVMITVCAIGLNRQSGVTGIDVSKLKSLGRSLELQEEAEQELSATSQHTGEEAQ